MTHPPCQFLRLEMQRHAGSRRGSRARASLGEAAIVALVIWLALTSQESRAALPAAVGTFNHDFSLNVYDFPASMTFGCGSLSITGGDTPSATAIGSNCTNAAQSILSYSFEIFGPANSALPLFVASTTSLDADGQAVAGATLAINGQILAGGNCYVSLRSGCGTHYSLAAMSFSANQLYTVSLNVIAHNSFGAGSAYAFLDPTFAFDPSFANAAAYRLEFSPGIGNGVPASPVPEPETAMLLLLGLAGVVAKRRFSRRHSHEHLPRHGLS